MKSNLSLEKVLEKTIDVLEESKKDMFDIAESSQKEHDNIKSELQLIGEEIGETINSVDRLIFINKRARIRLMEVSRDFHQYTESDIKNAYQRAEETSVEIAVLREKEEQLKRRRTELEKRLLNVQGNVEKAENLVSKVSVMKEFLKGELSCLNDQFDDLKQKQLLAIKIIQAQEEERQRLAREIHDGPAQSIANLVFRIELTQKLIDKDIVKARNELEQLKSMIRFSIQDVRKIIYDLRPMSLDDLGLVPTLKRYIDKFLEQTGVFIDFSVQGANKRLPNTYEVTIFRLIQEALNNIFKHAQISAGRVRLEFGLERVNLIISDDGIGFDSEKVSQDKYGLIFMGERCSLLGGSFKIKSEPKKGTIIKIILPIKRGEQDEENKSANC